MTTTGKPILATRCMHCNTLLSTPHELGSGLCLWCESLPKTWLRARGGLNLERDTLLPPHSTAWQERANIATAVLILTLALGFAFVVVAIFS